jgi:hypothetical protein
MTCLVFPGEACEDWERTVEFSDGSILNRFRQVTEMTSRGGVAFGSKTEFLLLLDPDKNNRVSFELTNQRSV